MFLSQFSFSPVKGWRIFKIDFSSDSCNSTYYERSEQEKISDQTQSKNGKSVLNTNASQVVELVSDEEDTHNY
jgi:hypothetical protein